MRKIFRYLFLIIFLLFITIFFSFNISRVNEEKHEIIFKKNANNEKFKTDFYINKIIQLHRNILQIESLDVEERITYLNEKETRCNKLTQSKQVHTLFFFIHHRHLSHNQFHLHEKQTRLKFIVIS